MKLLIRRKQRSEPSGGTLFTLTCKLQLTEEEQALAQRYGAPPLINLHQQEQDNRAFGVTTPPFTGLWQELSMTDFDIRKLHEREQEIITACNETAEYWQLAQNFQGTDEMEF